MNRQALILLIVGAGLASPTFASNRRATFQSLRSVNSGLVEAGVICSTLPSA